MEKVIIEMINHKHQEEAIEVIYMGELDNRGESAHVAYEESILTGMEGVNTEIFIDKKEVKIVRSGNIESKMIFKENYTDVFLYHMDVGTMTMALHTDKLEVVKSEQGFTISMKYFLTISGNDKDHNEMQINIIKK